jgi:plasmid stabilization system protein ParE
MMPFRFSPEAVDDLFEIWQYIAVDNIQAADRLEEAILNTCALLAKTPDMGHHRPDLTDRPVLFWTLPRYRNYMIVYDPASTPLTVIRILHGARNIPVILEEK